MNLREIANRAASRARAAVAGRKARRHGLVGRPELWQQKRDFQIAFLREHGLQPTHVLVDLGCGTLRGGIPIIAYLDESSYVGIDVRGEAIEEARNELQEHGLAHRRPELIATPSLASVDLGRTADYVWAFSVLMHLADERLDECLDFARRLLGDRVRIEDAAPGAGASFPSSRGRSTSIETEPSGGGSRCRTSARFPISGT